MNFALVGYGRWGKILARNLEQHPAIRLVGICHSSAPPQPGFYREMDALLTAQPLDAVVIAAPLHSRARLVEKALVAGKHVLTEKPLAETFEQAQSLVATARGRGLCLFTNYVHAYAQGVDLTLSRLSGLGPLRMLEVRFFQPGLMYRSENAMCLLGSHALAIIFRLIGEHPLEAHWLQTAWHQYANGLAATLEGNMYGGRTQARIAVHVGHPIRSRQVDVVTDTGTLNVSMTGDSGVTISRYPVELQADNVAPEVEHIGLDEQNNLPRVFDRFISAMRGAEPDNAELALAVQGALDRCKDGD